GKARSRCGCARQLRRLLGSDEGINRLCSQFFGTTRKNPVVPRTSPTYPWRVSAYEDLDAFKACHQLTLAVHRLAEKLEERDATLSGHLWAAALCASSRIARGSAFRNRRMFAACVDRTLSALSEISYYLDMGYAMGLISKEDRQEIESLGGRALFYSMKLVMSLAGGSPDETA